MNPMQVLASMRRTNTDARFSLHEATMAGVGLSFLWLFAIVQLVVPTLPDTCKLSTASEDSRGSEQDGKEAPQSQHPACRPTFPSKASNLKPTTCAAKERMALCLMMTPHSLAVESLLAPPGNWQDVETMTSAGKAVPVRAISCSS